MSYIRDEVFPNSEILNSSRLQYFAKKSILRSETTSSKQSTKSSIIDINSAISYNDVVMENIKDNLTIEISTNLSNNQAELKRLLRGREKMPTEIIDKEEEEEEEEDDDEENVNNVNEDNINNEYNKISNSNIEKFNSKNINNNNNLSFGNDDTTRVDKIQSLLVQQKTISREEMEIEQKTQLELSEDLLEMTTVLKKSTIRMNQSVTQQNIQLDSIQVHSADNIESLEEQRKMMSDSVKVMKTSIWSGLGSIFWILGMFVFTYLIMRILPKPT
jgi:hypothetical protein